MYHQHTNGVGRGAILAVLILSGCTRYTPRTPTPLVDYNAQVLAELTSGTWLTLYDQMPANTPTEIGSKIARRNHLLSEFIWSVDRNYDHFEVMFYAGKAEQDIVGDFLALGLGGAGVLTGNAHTKTIIALPASTALSGKTSIDERWYDSQSRELVVGEMRALRAEQLVVLKQGMQQDLGYSLNNGVLDVQTYFQAGSIVEALQQIKLASSQQLTAAKTALEQMRRTGSH